MLSLKGLTENNLASGGLWPRSPPVNKAVQHLFYGEKTKRFCLCTDLYHYCFISIPSIFAVFKVSSQNSVV